ncbi:hypothetical protein HELRODRAFT_183153 [Helobdella robusta]|uniref:Uncharacterized protein n=1 Tax=Helobdella robusta TaxID=6412 RepID=T1FJ79_HELRO|nr:hypothetical protein HELRODRAFT_183153 [Helobdella robusta]ESO11459.1 hypothetical protein HELRODRAFT_183153 [Helobdella robusta]
MSQPNDDPIAILSPFKKTASTNWFENAEVQYQLRNVVLKKKQDSITSSSKIITRRKTEHSSSSSHSSHSRNRLKLDKTLHERSEQVRTNNQSVNYVISNNVITNNIITKNIIDILKNKLNVSYSRTINYIISDKNNIITRDKINASHIGTNNHIFQEEWRNQSQHNKQTFFHLNGRVL